MFYKNFVYFQYSRSNLTTNYVYEVRVTAASRSNYTGRLIVGNVSESEMISLKPNCQEVQRFMKQSSSELGAGVIAGMICAVIAFLLAVTTFLLWKKCFRASYYYLDDPPCSVPIASLDWNVAPECGGDHKGAIPVHLFSKHVAELHADGDIGFSKEYEAIQAEAAQDDCSSEFSQHPDNRAKNRYLNIIACKYSLVIYYNRWKNP